MAMKASFKMVRAFQGHHLQSDVNFNQVINTTSKLPPYNLNLNRGFTSGCEITVTGSSKPGVDAFFINLSTSSDIAFHFNPRFRDGVIVRNVKRNGRWETEERDGFLPIQPGQQFILTIICETDGYKISINGSFFTYFRHRISSGLVNRLETNTNVFINQITYKALLAGKGSPASSGCRIELQHGFKAGSELIITGMAQAYQERFSIDFESSVPGRGVDKIFIFCPLFREGVVERSSFVGGRWGLKERDGGLPFRMGVTFHLQFKCEPEGYKIYIDGKLFAFFKHRHPNVTVTHVNFTGSIVFSKVDYHTQLEAEGLKESEGKWYGAPDTTGTKDRWYREPDMPETERQWHGESPLYPNLEDTLTKGVSKLGLDWGSDKSVLNLSRSKSSFDISTVSQKQPMRGRNKRHQRSKRSHTPDPTYKKSLVQLNFPFIQEFDCDWRSSPYKLLLNQGFEPGSEITIVGSVPYGSDRFQVNLIQRNGDIGLHLAPRFYEGVIVRNTRIMGTWGVEERDGGLPFSNGDQFTINIYSEQDAYKVFVNNTLFTRFRRRTGGPVAYLDIQDDVSINKVVYQCTMRTHGSDILLEKGFWPGSEVTIIGQIESNRDRFSVDLESPGSVTDILLHTELRWRESSAVLNSFVDGYWSHEQIERGLSVYPGASVRVCIKSESDGFQVFVNDTFLAFYHQRYTAREIRNLAVRGGFQLNMIKYCTKI